MTHKSLLLCTAAALTLMLTTATTSQAARHHRHHGASQFAPGRLAARPGGARFFAPGHRQTIPGGAKTFAPGTECDDDVICLWLVLSRAAQLKLGARDETPSTPGYLLIIFYRIW